MTIKIIPKTNKKRPAFGPIIYGKLIKGGVYVSLIPLDIASENPFISSL